MKREKDHYNVLAVCMLRDFAGREILTGILDEMSNRMNWHLVTTGPRRLFSERELTNEDGESFDGWILTMPGTDAVMRRIAASCKPTVLVNITDRSLSARKDAVASVWTDNADIGRCAARHILERGKYASAGYVHEIDEVFYSMERMMSFRSAMKMANMATSVFDSHKAMDFAAELRRWVRDLPKPAAVMACSDMRAADVINACSKEDIHVPEQVAVIGVDNDAAQHEKCGMSISSVILNMRDMGRQSVRELDFLFRHPKCHGRLHEILIPAKGVFAGESTARSALATKLVKMAQEFIAGHHAEKISPDDVARHLGCSRQLAELRFSQICGKTVRRAIEDARMGEATRRLKNGETVRGIVKAMHFTSANQFYRIYKRHFGHTLRQAGD